MERVHPEIRMKTCKRTTLRVVSEALFGVLEKVGAVKQDRVSLVMLSSACLSLQAVPISATGLQG